MSTTDKSELEKIVTQGTLGYMTAKEVTAAIQPLVIKQCNQARIKDIRAWDEFFSGFSATTPIDVHSWSEKRITTILAQAKETEKE